jgi:hypothetical protein
MLKGLAAEVAPPGIAIRDKRESLLNGRQLEDYSSAEYSVTGGNQVATGVDLGGMLPSVEPASLTPADSKLAKRNHEKQFFGARARSCDEWVHVGASADGGGGVEALPFGQPGRVTSDYRG